MGQVNEDTDTSSFSFEQGEFSQVQLIYSSHCKERPGQGPGLELKAREASQCYTKQGEIHLCTSPHPWESQSFWFAKPFNNVPK